MPQTSYVETCIVAAILKDHDLKLSVKKSNQDLQEGSCSGIMLDGRQGLVLTHATLLLPLVNALDGMKADGNFLKSLIPQVSFKVVLEETFSDGSHPTKDVVRQGRKPYFTALMNIATKSSILRDGTSKTPQRRLKKYKASIRHMFQVASFADALVRLMPPSEGWRFTDDSQETSSNESTTEPQPEQLQNLLSHFFILKIDDWKPQAYQHPHIYPSRKLHLGDPVFAQSTPFGILSAPVFMNSLSKGVISNLAGQENCLLLTDARCIPGGEGGAIYWGSDVRRLQLAGIVVASLCWKLNEWMGLTVACSMSEVLKALSQEAGYSLAPGEHRTLKDIPRQLSDKDPLVFLVQCGSNWGSGVLVDPTRGLVLTCSHVIKSADLASVHISHQRSSSKLSVQVIYRAPPGAVFDIALLRVVPPVEWESLPKPSIGFPAEGSVVRVLGHGCFGASHQMSPSVFQGVVSKVLQVRESPVLVQSSCAVHAGASGGALVDRSGNIIGIVACNARDTSSGASYPHINMSIPMCYIWPVIQEYIETQDRACLRHVVTGDPEVLNLWSLKLSEFVTSPSKL